MTNTQTRRIAIMGIRGLPAQHGGFETFAERLAPYLVRCGWEVTVYCQEDQAGLASESLWQGVRRVHIGVGEDTALNSIHFDWACIKHAAREKIPLVLTLGYNTAVLGLRLRMAGICHVINMDGIEWARDKWGPLAKAWLYLNDWAGCMGANHLLADHPMIARHLAGRVSKRKISTIPYGTDIIRQAPASLLEPVGVESGKFVTLIARPEPENSVYDIVKAFSARPRGVKLLVLGSYKPQQSSFHAKVMEAASQDVIFGGAIYDHEVVNALRLHGLLYLHGHQVGGTNPSLVEAMGAGNPVLAHDNRFNRWVVREGAWYFKDSDSCGDALDALLADPEERQRMSRANRQRAVEAFSWPVVLSQYEVTLSVLYGRAAGAMGDVTPPYAGSLDTVNTIDLL